MNKAWRDWAPSYNTKEPNKMIDGLTIFLIFSLIVAIFLYNDPTL